MNIYRYKKDGKLYTVEHLIYDIHHLNNNGFAGIYATPYLWTGKVVRHTKQTQASLGEPFDPMAFFISNFTKVSELRSL